MDTTQKPALIIMAAGMGSRFGGLKQVTPVGPCGELIIDYSIYDAIAAGFGRVVFVIKKEIEETFKEHIGNRISRQIPVSYVYQELDALPEGFSVPEGRAKPWGTGHAVLCAVSLRFGGGFGHGRLFRRRSFGRGRGFRGGYLGGRGGLGVSAAAGESERQQRGKQQSKDLFHVVLSPLVFYQSIA